MFHCHIKLFTESAFAITVIKLPEDDILNVETCRSMLFVITVFGIIVQSLVKLYITNFALTLTCPKDKEQLISRVVIASLYPSCKQIGMY